ncbi:CopG family transcriptional regulator [Tumidithrix helvetica PCC 7403]|uniref:CopG family transcriptional regulator n=1 Tax=Tumidithrix helvetica TaxID=3457545 RepID=UPI003CA3F05B
MSPTVIYLPEQTEQILAQLAAQSDKTPSEIVQEALQLYWINKPKKRSKCIGMGKSGIPNLSEHIDELLWNES